MDGLIIIRSTVLSYHIARTRILEGVVASYFWALRGHGRDNAITSNRRERAIKSQCWSKELEDIIHKISFQRTLKTILK
jgi:hypothetical protein